MRTVLPCGCTGEFCCESSALPHLSVFSNTPAETTPWSWGICCGQNMVCDAAAGRCMPSWTSCGLSGVTFRSTGTVAKAAGCGPGLRSSRRAGCCRMPYPFVFPGISQRLCEQLPEKLRYCLRRRQRAQCRPLVAGTPWRSRNRETFPDAEVPEEAAVRRRRPAGQHPGTSAPFSASITQADAYHSEPPLVSS